MATAASKETEILENAKSMLPPDYTPSEDEEYMNELQQAYFRMLLIEWKRSIRDAAENTLQSLADGPIREADLNDRASSETDWGIELRTRDRQRKLVSKIDAALRRLDEGEYGYCEVTGDPIGLRRLIARPVATMTVEAQEAHERNERSPATTREPLHRGLSPGMDSVSCFLPYHFGTRPPSAPVRCFSFTVRLPRIPSARLRADAMFSPL